MKLHSYVLTGALSLITTLGFTVSSNPIAIACDGFWDCASQGLHKLDPTDRRTVPGGAIHSVLNDGVYTLKVRNSCDRDLTAEIQIIPYDEDDWDYRTVEIASGSTMPIGLTQNSNFGISAKSDDGELSWKFKTVAVTGINDGKPYTYTMRCET